MAEWERRRKEEWSDDLHRFRFHVGSELYATRDRVFELCGMGSSLKCHPSCTLQSYENTGVSNRL